VIYKTLYTENYGLSNTHTIKNLEFVVLLYLYIHVLVRKDMYVNEHVRLSNITLRHKLK